MAKNSVKASGSGQSVTIDPPPPNDREIHKMVKARMEQLKPLIEEYYQLVKVEIALRDSK